MAITTLAHPVGDILAERAAARSLVAEWLLAMGPVVHRLDYGGRVAAVGCGDGATTALLATAYPLATLDALDPDPAAVAAARSAVQRAGAASRCEVVVADAGSLRPGAYDLVCVLHGLALVDDPVALARHALRAVRPTGALMVVEHHCTDAFADGPLVVGGWLQQAGAARVRLASADPQGFVLDARPDH